MTKHLVFLTGLFMPFTSVLSFHSNISITSLILVLLIRFSYIKLIFLICAWISIMVPTLFNFESGIIYSFALLYFFTVHILSIGTLSKSQHIGFFENGLFIALVISVLFISIEFLVINIGIKIDFIPRVVSYSGVYDATALGGLVYRPIGLSEETGHSALFISLAAVYLREANKINWRIFYLLTILIVITFSVTALAVCLIYMVYSFRVFFLALLLLFGLILFELYQLDIIGQFLTRLASISGTVRIDRASAAIYQLFSDNRFFFGLGGDFSKYKLLPPIGFIPLFTAVYGIFVPLFFVGFSFLATNRQNLFAKNKLLSITLITLSFSVINNFWYSFLIVLPILLTRNVKQNA